MGITLLSDIDRYTLEDALVELFYHLKLPDASYEEVSMGIFEVSEANRNIEIHQPEETWHSGKHSIMMYYPIENLVANYRNIFNVYARATGVTVMVDTGD